MPASYAQDIETLQQILLHHSVRFGEFTLVSGQKSNVYVDSKLTTYLPEAIPLIGRLFISKMMARGWDPQATGGLTLGADPIAFAIARESAEHAGHPIRAFVARKEPKKHGTQRFIEGLEDTGGLRVVVIDDVCSTGGSTAKAIELAKDAGMQVLGAICLVDREMGASDLLKNDFGCELESVFKLSDLRETS
jgi:orotate phosphoribosyltransferase